MISINVNPAASGAGLNLGKANDALQKSLSRLSSGRRIVNSSDDAGGLAVSMKMAAAQKRTEATAINLRNIQSYLDTQDGAFKVADKVLSRMSELTTLARDVTKNSGDVENYDKEFQNLQLQLTSLGTEKFNGVALFDPSVGTGSKFSVPTSEDGSQSTTVTKSAMGGDPWVSMMINGFNTSVTTGGTTVYIPAGGTVGYTLNDPTTPVTLGTSAATSVSSSGTLTYDNSDEFVQVVQMALQQVADMRAQNGAEMSRVNFAQDLLNINAINLEAANSRIIDVDVAAESSQLARFQILQQAGTAMLAQANTSQQSLVRLLQG
ncbi:MAG: flagellin [Proteobacteria bacterium]|nr:flagellin [Pseudomonadota bacterium]